jgi:deazaflavin-dependent oxidoreductase (nitroreductase family)
MTASTNEYLNHNNDIIQKFRANNGAAPNGAPLLLLTTTGARSGQPRINPLAFTRDGDRYVVIASKGGHPSHPDWYHNLVASPAVTVEVDGQKFSARALVTEGSERDRLFNAQAVLMPNFAEYQTKTERKIPVIVLEPITG